MSDYEKISLIIAIIAGLFSIAGAIVSWIGLRKTNKVKEIAEEINAKVVHYNDTLNFNTIQVKCKEVSSLLTNWSTNAKGLNLEKAHIQIQEYINLLSENIFLFNEAQIDIEEDINFLQNHINIFDNANNGTNKNEIRELISHNNSISNSINSKMRTNFRKNIN